MENYFLEFKKELDSLYANNVVIAGSNILKLHGLELGWEPQDLDIIIFCPTKEQKELVELKLEFEANADYKQQVALESIGEEIRSWSVKRNGLKLNAIYDEREVPENLMLFYIGGRIWICNSIKNILDAKLSYSVGDNKNYLRRKDVDHFIKLKNNNFNIDVNSLLDAGKKIQTLPGTDLPY